MAKDKSKIKELEELDENRDSYSIEEKIFNMTSSQICLTENLGGICNGERIQVTTTRNKL